MKINVFILSFLILFFNACSFKEHQLFHKNLNQYISSDFYKMTPYIIRPYDRLSIKVYGYPELSVDGKQDEKDKGVKVSRDGTILLPLLGRMRVAGYSKSKLENRLYKLYNRYLEKRTAVKVELLNQNVYVLGEVKNPGPVDMIKFRSLTPIKSIAQRGGLTDFAKRDKILVIRGTINNYKVAVLDFTDMANFRRNNFLLQPEDIIYVAHNKSKDLNLPINGMKPTFSLLSALFNTVAMYKMVN